jgi:hypothetical protein
MRENIALEKRGKLLVESPGGPVCFGLRDIRQGQHHAVGILTAHITNYSNRHAKQQLRHLWNEGIRHNHDVTGTLTIVFNSVETWQR